MLTADGHLLIMGINPFSMFGCVRGVSRSRSRVPWSGKTYSRARLTDWLSVLGFRLVGIDTVFLRPPVNRERLLNASSFIEKLQPVAGLGGAIYLIHARKQVATLTQVRQHWRAPRGRLVQGAFAQRANRRTGDSANRQSTEE